ncbi:MAG: alpha-hydroxy-acid oxidizing protein [Deltaproteobacteria bacterium]|nr:alpha-hydroxy-acid oxidizing protein [Deltaproteobacteria bacterium]
MTDPMNVEEFEALAAAKVPAPAWDYYRSGADDEVTLRANRAAWGQIELHYRVLVDVSDVSTQTTLFGTELSSPVVVAPTAFHRLAHPEGELATVRGAGAAGCAMTLSTLSNTPVEDVGKAANAPLWFQLYVYRDRDATAALVARAEAAGCTALVLTVDAPVLGRRERDVRNRFTLPDHLSIENMLAPGYGSMPDAPTDSGLAAYFSSLLDPSLSWRDLEWLAGITSLPILVKGVVRPDDAKRALDVGAGGVVVSNHGGRQLDGSPATASVLRAVVEGVEGRGVVLVDGGVRRGTDVLKALALGADGVMVGRPVLWGLGAAGAQGVTEVLEMLRSELERAQALCGCPRLADLSPDLLRSPW